jgi:hypothetical protein
LGVIYRKQKFFGINNIVLAKKNHLTVIFFCVKFKNKSSSNLMKWDEISTTILFNNNNPVGQKMSIDVLHMLIF